MSERHIRTPAASPAAPAISPSAIAAPASAAPSLPLAAPSTAEIRTMYGYLAVFAYLLYAMGYVTPYLRDDLGLSEFATGLHATALAVGTLLAGIVVDATARRLGSHRTVILSVWLCVIAAILIVSAPALPVSLGGALLLGLAGGMLGTHVNIALGSAGGGSARKLLARANAWAMATAVVAPVLIAAAASAALGWRFAIAAPAGCVLLVAIVGTSEERSGSSGPRSPRLPSPYWAAWSFVVLAVAIEFSFVFWSSSLVAHRTGSPKETATLLAGLFVAGMLLGRLAVGTSRVADRSPRRLLAAGILTVALGAFLAWASPEPVLSGVGLLLGGFGTAGLYPVGVSVALQKAPGAELTAAARLTLASGLAIFIAPLMLGVAADMVGVVAAWPLVLGVAGGALVVAFAITRAPGDAPVPEGAPQERGVSARLPD